MAVRPTTTTITATVSPQQLGRWRPSRFARAGLGSEAPPPSVSCTCPIYNPLPHHQHLLEEAIASFIGDKQNAAVGLARCELIAPWDDDISLPWRLLLSVERLGDADYFNPRCYWFLDNEGLHFDHSMGYANNASLFRRAAFEGVGGYTSQSFGADAALDAAFSGLAHAAVDPLGGNWT